MSPISSKIDFKGGPIFESAARFFIIIHKFILHPFLKPKFTKQNSLTTKKFIFEGRFSIIIIYLSKGSSFITFQTRYYMNISVSNQNFCLTTAVATVQKSLLISTYIFQDNFEIKLSQNDFNLIILKISGLWIEVFSQASKRLKTLKDNE